MLHPVTVSPVAGGWMVEAEALAAPLMFLSGGRAEDAAWRVARALAENGKWAEITIKTRDGFRMSRFLCPPEEVVGWGGMKTATHFRGDMTDRVRASSPRTPLFQDPMAEWPQRRGGPRYGGQQPGGDASVMERRTPS